MLIQFSQVGQDNLLTFPSWWHIPSEPTEVSALQVQIFDDTEDGGIIEQCLVQEL